MKPRLRFKGGVWSCTSYRLECGLYVFRVGMGYDVRSAFNDWWQQEFA